MTNNINTSIFDTFSKVTTWCESYLRDPRDREKPLYLRSYQKEVTDNSRENTNIILRWGRRMGKSVVMCADCLWWAQAWPLVQMAENGGKKQKPFTILVFAPYESQVKELWNTFTQLIGDSPLLKDQVKKVRTSDVHSIEFKNGSVIKGYTIGISSSNQGTSLRGLCLDGSTRISMYDGSTKLITDVSIGDKIISYNKNTKSFEKDEILAIADPSNKEMYEIEFSSGRKVIASLDHKFLTDSDYKSLSDIKIGDKIVLGNNLKKGIRTNRTETYDLIIDITKIGYRTAYDITTKKNHNFLANGVVTHNSGDMIFIDEMDFIPTEIIEQVILPITTTHKNCIRRVCSTPSGKRELYFQWCSRAEELGWLHLHHPSWHPDNDNWMSQEEAKQKGIPIHQSTEFQVRSVTSSDAYDREYGGEFGEEHGGVYKDHLISKSLVKYGRNINVSDPDVFDPGFTQNSDHKYIIGVDWNSYINGGQIVMIEYCSTPTRMTYFDDDTKQDITIDFTGKYRLFYRRGIKSRKATQRLTRAEIIRLMTHYKVDYLYVDYGAGDTNIEELTLHGRQHPELQLERKLRVIDSGATVDHYDHILQKMVKKRNKSLMINFSVLSLEEGMFILPKEEDSKTRLVGQMRGYKVKHVTTRGEFAYEGEDHILDAFNLAIYGFQQNYGQLLTSRVPFAMNHFSDPRLNEYPRRETIDQQREGFHQNPFGAKEADGFIDPEKAPKLNKPARIQMPRFGGRSLTPGRGSFGRGIF